ncbi:MAG TPA: alpha/beta hydrolase [Candidatus Saccharimonadales bacterium]|nr:alpha/beta hydrolase [Candidatus Saccharimonadales bacterium]
MQSLKIPCVGYELAADWYDGEKDEVLLVIPGWSSNKENYQDIVGAITGMTGMGALVVDLAGHGESPFRLPDLMPAQNFLDVLTAFDWLVTNYPGKAINVMGTSYGGYLAAYLASYRPVHKLVLRAPAIYRPENFYMKWGNIDREENKEVYRQDAAAISRNPIFAGSGNFHGKALVVVHELDEEIPRVTSDAYIRAFNADQYVAEGLTHRMTQFLNERSRVVAYQKAIADWLSGTPSDPSAS